MMQRHWTERMDVKPWRPTPDENRVAQGHRKSSAVQRAGLRRAKPAFGLNRLGFAAFAQPTRAG